MGKRELLARLVGRTPLGGLLRRTRLGDGLMVVCYHRVGEARESPGDPALFSATAEAFEAHVQRFKLDFDIVSPDDLPRVRGARGRHLQITFDDGYRDSYELAFPILARHKIPATFFLATGFLDAPRVPWWDELAWMVRSSRRAGLPRGRWLPEPVPLGSPAARGAALRLLNELYVRTPPADRDALLAWLGEATGAGRCDARSARDLWMTWDMVREMRRAGMSFGAHTVRHPELSRLPREAQAEEIEASKRRVEDETRAPVSVFAYPYGWVGSFDGDTRACLRAAGVAFAYANYGGHQTAGAWDPYEMRRVSIEGDQSEDLIAAMGTIPRWLARPSHDSPHVRGHARQRPSASATPAT